MENDNRWERCVKNAMTFLRNNPELAEFVRTFSNDETGFLLSADPRLGTIEQALDADGHSGASFACCLRACQSKLRNMTLEGPPTDAVATVTAPDNNGN